MSLPLLNSEPLPFLLGRIDLSLPVILTSLPRRSALRPSAARSPPCRSSARALLRPHAPPLPALLLSPALLLCPRASPSSRCSSSAALLLSPYTAPLPSRRSLECPCAAAFSSDVRARAAFSVDAWVAWPSPARLGQRSLLQPGFCGSDSSPTRCNRGASASSGKRRPGCRREEDGRFSNP